MSRVASKSFEDLVFDEEGVSDEFTFEIELAGKEIQITAVVLKNTEAQITEDGEESPAGAYTVAPLNEGLLNHPTYGLTEHGVTKFFQFEPITVECSYVYH